MTHEEELIELLDKETTAQECNTKDLQEQQKIIERTFNQYGVQCKIMNAGIGPRVNCFEFAIEDITSREHLITFKADICDEIKRILGKKDNIRLLSPMPNLVGCSLEIPNGNQPEVTAGELFRSKEWRNWRAILPLMLGKGWAGEIRGLDLARAPHLLMAGCTGSGKSVFMDSCIHSLMFRYTPYELKLILADSKIVEFSKYKNLPYLLFPVINSTRDTLRALQWLTSEMECRYKILHDTGCGDIKTLNEQRPGSLPYVVMIIDEFSDYLAEAKTQMESLLAHLCAIGRAAGIHLILSTQRLDSQVLTGSIRANFPVRIAFRVAAHTDSKRILGVDDAADLLGLGDMLFRGPGSVELTRIQGVYINDRESARIMEHLKSMYGDMKPNTLPHMRGTVCNQIDVLHGKLVDIARDALEDNLDSLKEDAIDDACEEIADSIIEHWDELKETDFDMDEDSKGDDVEEADSESDVGLSDEEKELLQKAIQIVIKSRRPLISYIQRSLSIGYNRACALIEAMERYGIVSPEVGTEPRTILVDTYEEAIARLPRQNYGHD